MSGRDVIGIAKTGSGKTLAFLLPMLRHIMDQPELGEGEGPIGLIMAPARELAIQIYNEARKFTKALNLRVTAVYGGASVADQIGELKRGADIVVCTPGRMIDILTMQAGKLISLSRVSFVVLDEADRMFDLGFEPQIRMILQNIRPDRQTCLFSATFPQKVEALARKVLVAPVEIVVGGRSVVNTAIVQHVEVRGEEDKFMRLLQLLGVWFERGHVLVFVDTQARCERLFEDLMRAGYPCLSLHGGKEQIDRDDAIASFKNKVRTLMVATSVAGRGLDVPDLVCVVNYSCPNHLEEYVHRVGRTGRANRKGTAYTFISPDEEQFAPVLEKALRQSQQEVPPALQAMADSFRSKIDAGQARWASSGFGGTGFKFDPLEKNKAQKMIDMQRRQYEVDQGLRDEADFYSDDSAEEEEVSGDGKAAAAAQAAAAVGAGAADGLASSAVVVAGALTGETPLERAKRIAAQLAGGGSSALVAHAAPSLAVLQALASAKRFAEKVGISSSSGAEKTHWVEELCINEYPQKARWKITHRETIDDVSEKFEVAIISRGNYIAPGKKPGPNEKKLYLSIEGHSDLSVSGARRELTRILNEETMRVGLDPSTRYSVV
jgi:ATP-dependent RNA helicase DDX46/PRP5